MVEQPVPALLSKSSATETAPWRSKHETLVKVIRNAKSSHTAPYEKPSGRGGHRMAVDVATAQCPYCERTFSDEAAERHMPICKENQLKNQFKQRSNKGPSDKQKALMKRIKFQPTLP